MKSDLRVLCQYKENYNVGPEGVNTFGDKQPHWKMKGGVEFIIEGIADDMLMYGEEGEIRRTIEALLEAENNEMCEYEYISHERVGEKPHPLGTAKKFEELLGEKMNFRYAQDAADRRYEHDEKAYLSGGDY